MHPLHPPPRSAPDFNISLRGTELNADFGRNASATVPVEVFHSSGQDATIRGKELNKHILI